MLRREDLEAIDATGAGWEGVDTYQFRRASVKLALACLEARLLVGRWNLDKVARFPELSRECEKLRFELDAALEAAGVEAEP